MNPFEFGFYDELEKLAARKGGKLVKINFIGNRRGGVTRVNYPQQPPTIKPGDSVIRTPEERLQAMRDLANPSRPIFEAPSEGPIRIRRPNQ